MPDISLMIISHNKPRFVLDAVNSVLKQTFTDWEGVLIDSGILYDQGIFKDIKDPRLTIIKSGETRELAKTKNMASWCLNKVLNSHPFKGELFVYIDDDDIYYPDALETFWNFYISHDRKIDAMYASQHIGLVDKDGKTQIVGERVADRPAGQFCKGRKLDCQVDYLQFCHTFRILKKLGEVLGTTQYHVEDKAHGHHADGVFMEQIGKLTTVHPIKKFICINRRTADSTNLEYATSPIGRAMATVKAKAKGARQKLFGPKPY